MAIYELKSLWILHILHNLQTAFRHNLLAILFNTILYNIWFCSLCSIIQYDIIFIE